MTRFVLTLATVAGLFMCTGCTEDESTPVPAASAVDGSKYLMQSAPDAPAEVIAARESAADGDEVVVAGRIGGASNPWIEGRAAFTIVDASLKACSDIPGDQCPKPWDYCCVAKEELASGTVLVKVVDEQNQLVPHDAKQLLNVEELSSVIVKGKAQRDDDGNLTVLANQVYVER